MIVGMGVTLFVWQTIKDFFRDFILPQPREHNELHLHQHVHSDPTRPGEDEHPVIEIPRKP